MCPDVLEFPLKTRWVTLVRNQASLQKSNHGRLPVSDPRAGCTPASMHTSVVFATATEHRNSPYSAKGAGFVSWYVYQLPHCQKRPRSGSLAETSKLSYGIG